ncbi:MAG: site-specific integrase [Chloroflexota bacterium]|nr:site-specific integrase [Chloroflexota bacterium]
MDLGWEAGKRRRKVVYGRDRAEVSRKVSQLLNQHQRGLPIQTANKTVKVFLTEWLDQAVKPSKSYGTHRAYNVIVNRHLVPAIGKHPIEKLTQQHVQAMLNAKQVEGLSLATVRQIRVVLRIALNQAMRWDLVGRNVAALTTPPGGERFEGYGISTDEVRAIMSAVRGDDLEALYAIATSVGLRLAELTGLRWLDVDMDNGLIQVRRQLKVIDGTPQLVDLKTKSSRRTVPLAPPVLRILRAHRTRQIAQRLVHGVPWSESGFVFAWQDGGSISESYVRKHWFTVRKAAGLPDRVRFHDLRHGALTIMAARGTAPRTLIGIAGHSQIVTTMQVYAHLDAENVRTATGLMSDLYEGERDAL